MTQTLKDLFLKTCRIIFFLSVVSFLLGAFVQTSSAATYYMPDDFGTLQEAMAGMSGGDTLIVRDGMYTGSMNIIDNSHYPPNGSSDAYTIIKAEHVGKAIFDGGGSNIPVNKVWSDSDKGMYIQFEGLQFKKSSGSLFSLVYVSHIKIKNCSFVDAFSGGTGKNDSCFFRYADHCLVEDSWAWGYGRYNFYFLDSKYMILRRCIVRKDRYNTTASRGNAGDFQIYNCEHVLVQNCIGIDGDQSAYYSGSDGDSPSVFWTAFNGGPTVDITYNGCIALHNTSMRNVVASPNSNNLKFTNCVFWDSLSGFWCRNSGNTVEHCVSGVISKDDTDACCYRFDYDIDVEISNSIAYNSVHKFGIWNGTSSHNALYSNSSNYFSVESATADITDVDPIDGNPGNGTPALKYLVRIEDGSNLDSAASDGGDIGATVLKRIGVSGTLWGDSGYNVVTDEDLWPFPNEDRIREDMRAYSYDNGNLSGARGFCSDGQTLTKYIWEYLGHTIPAEIYGGAATPQNESPVASAGPDQVIADNDNNGYEAVNLNGSSSFDSDGHIVSYVWTENSQQVGTGMTPTVSMCTGVHTLMLFVTDDQGASAQDSVQITVVPGGGQVLQDFEDGVLWHQGGSEDVKGYGRGWLCYYPDSGEVTTDNIEIDNEKGANGTHKSLKITIPMSRASFYFASPDKITDHFPEAQGANRMSFYVRFPSDFPVQSEPYRYHTFEVGTFIHDPSNWDDTHSATSFDDHGIHHYYHYLTIEQTGDGWVKYIVTTKPDHHVNEGVSVPEDMPYYFNDFGRFYFDFGETAGGVPLNKPYTIWIDEIKFYYDDGTVGGQVHVGGQDDAGFDGEFFPDSSGGGGGSSPDVSPPAPPTGLGVR